MGKLIYSGITSLDGYINDSTGNFDWAEPDAEVHAFVNDRERPIGTYLYGRKMYEMMRYWETAHTEAEQSAVARDYTTLWQAADKFVYSTSLTEVTTARTTLEDSFDPDAIRRLKESTDRDITIGGAQLAAHAISAGLVDEWEQYLNPVVVGGGTAYFPDDVGVRLELLEERRFANGVVFLHYRTRS